MRTFIFEKSQFISPTDPVVSIQTAIDCDGSECGLAVHDANGVQILLPPHFHLVESQEGAWTRHFGVGGELPGDNYEPSHEAP